MAQKEINNFVCVPVHVSEMITLWVTKDNQANFPIQQADLNENADEEGGKFTSFRIDFMNNIDSSYFQVSVIR